MGMGFMNEGRLVAWENGWNQSGQPKPVRRFAGASLRAVGCGEPMIHWVRTRKKRGDGVVSMGTRVEVDSGASRMGRISVHGPTGDGADSTR